MRTSFHHQSEAQPPNGPLTAATSPDTPSLGPATRRRKTACLLNSFGDQKRIVPQFTPHSFAVGSDQIK
jgi:hypothetical protein